MAFHILGDERGAAIKAIRTLPASAAVLAMSAGSSASESRSMAAHMRPTFTC
jgi:hypothetical protein